jgi:hypothetical protein
VPTRKCTTCLTEQPPDQFHERFSNVCQHVERTICNKCIYNKAKTLLETSNKTEINCPEPHCTAKFNLKYIRQLLRTFNKTEPVGNVNRQSKNHPAERKTEFIWCAHEECGSGQFHVMNQNFSPIVTCVLCKRQTCAVHRVKWHKGMTCNEYDQQQAVPVITVKQCPKCQSNIENNLGSDRVICSKCKCEYCWECMADYKQIQKKGSRHHKTTCSQYENNPKQQASKSSACTIL